MTSSVGDAQVDSQYNQILRRYRRIKSISEIFKSSFIATSAGSWKVGETARQQRITRQGRERDLSSLDIKIEMVVSGSTEKGHTPRDHNSYHTFLELSSSQTKSD